MRSLKGMPSARSSRKTLVINGTLRAPAFLWSGGNWNAVNSSGLVTTIDARECNNYFANAGYASVTA